MFYKPLAFFHIKILTTVKEKLLEDFATVYSRSGVNQMWILKNSKKLEENLNSQNFTKINSFKTYDFSTLHNHSP